MTHFKCSCGSDKFHTFYIYHSINRSRIRCLQCNKTYQRDGSKHKEIDLKAMWEEAVKSAKEQGGTSF